MTDHKHEPRPGTLRDWAGWHRAEELAFDYPMNATCLHCDKPITREAGAPWVTGESPAAAPAAESPTDLHEGERVHTNYELPGTHPVLVIGLTTRGRLLWGTRKGTGWAYSPEWTGMITVGVEQLQEVLEQIRVDQARDLRATYPSQLRLQLRDVLLAGGEVGITLAEVLAAPVAYAVDDTRRSTRAKLIEELARMKDDGEVRFSGPRYVLTGATS